MPQKSLESTTTTKVRYSETDQMGYVYYGNYAVFYELGRVDLFNSLGVSYAHLEKELRIGMPVIHMEINYKNPAFYNDEIYIKTIVKERPNIRVTFHHELYKLIGSKKQILNIGTVTLVFMNLDTNRLVRPPKCVLEVFDAF